MMNWEAIGAIGEIVGAMAVVTTLIYLAIQMRVNTAEIQQSSTHSTLVGRAESLRFLASDGEISALWWKGADSPDELSQEEWQRYILLVASTLRSIEIAFLDHDSGRMSPELWHAQHESVFYWARTPGFQKAFDAYGQTFHPKFRNHLTSLIENERLKDNNEKRQIL